MKTLKTFLLTACFLIYIELLFLGIPISTFLPKINSILAEKHLHIETSANVWIKLSFPILPRIHINDLELSHVANNKSSLIIKAEHINVDPSIAGIIFRDYNINFLSISNSNIYLDAFDKLPKGKASKNLEKGSLLDLDKWIKEFVLKDVSMHKKINNKNNIIQFDYAKYSGTFVNSKLSLQGSLNHVPFYIDADTVFTPNDVYINNLSVLYKTSKLKGEFKVNKNNEKYSIYSKLEIPMLNISDFSSSESVKKDKYKKTNDVKLPWDLLQNTL